MKFQYKIPDDWIPKIAKMEEFVNGATQVTVETNSGNIIHEVLISNSMYVIAVRHHKDIPFDLNEIKNIYQASGDKSPKNRGGWEYWDKWEQ